MIIKREVENEKAPTYIIEDLPGKDVPFVLLSSNAYGTRFSSMVAIK